MIYLILSLIRKNVSFKQISAQMIDIDPISLNIYSEPVIEGISDIVYMILLDDVSDFNAEGFSSNVKNMHFVGHFCFNNEKNTINDQKTYFKGDGIMWICTYLCFVFSFYIWLPKNWNSIQLFLHLDFMFIANLIDFSKFCVKSVYFIQIIKNSTKFSINSQIIKII